MNSEAANGVMGRLMTELGRLPGIGPKTAERLTHRVILAGTRPRARAARAVSYAGRWRGALPVPGIGLRVTLGELADLPEYKSQFLRLFGFGIDGVDYAKDVDPRVVPG